MDIKDLRLKNGLSQVKLAELTGIPEGRINNWEQGKGKPKADDSKILKNFFDTYQVKVSGKKRVPFYDIDAEGGLMGGDSSPVKLSSGTIDVGDLLIDSECAIRISGNSMMPNYPPGCVVGLIKRKDQFIEPGEVYVLDTRDGRILKRLFYKNDDSMSEYLTCYSDNIMNFQGGPRDGRPCYPAYDVHRENDVIAIFTVVGVIKRNTNSMIVYKN